MITDFRLKVFETVAVQKSFTKAAKSLGISQPAVSQNIAELEQQIGDSILVRGQGGVTLTEKGVLLLDYSRRILHLYDCLNRELVPVASPSTAVIRIGACPIAAKFLLPGTIEKFKSIYPGVEIVLLERENFEMENLLSRKMIDIAVSEMRPQGCISEPFIDMNLSGGQKNVKSIFFAFRQDSTLKETIGSFILTAKTCI